MAELKFSGAATVSGFPRDKAFGFELDGDKLIVKAGKDIFLTIEKEAAPVKDRTPETYPGYDTIQKGEPVAAPAVPADSPEGKRIINSITEQVSNQGAAPEAKERKPRGPNITIDENLLITVRQGSNPYTKLRGTYFDTLTTASGRSVAWWKNTEMVKKLEGNAMTMLKFFIGDDTVRLVADPAAQQPTPAPQPVVAAPAQQPQAATFGSPTTQAQPTPGPIWTPPSGPVTPGNGGGPSFM